MTATIMPHVCLYRQKKHCISHFFCKNRRRTVRAEIRQVMGLPLILLKKEDGFLGDR